MLPKAYKVWGVQCKVLFVSTIRDIPSKVHFIHSMKLNLHVENYSWNITAKIGSSLHCCILHMKYVQQMHTRALTISNEYLALVK